MTQAGGLPLRDVIDWLWLSDGPTVGISVTARDGARRDLRLERSPGEPWGIGFDGLLFDGIRVCDNACGFCFVAQLPPGLRPSLYVRDDDFRLSFLCGNFVTLTNVGDDDIARIVEQRLSPLYVSLHAVDADVRRGLMCPTGVDRGLERIDSLLAGGITLHAQVVLVPGINDGDELERTLTWCAERPQIASVGIVPVGRTRHGARVSGGSDEPSAAVRVIEVLEPWRDRMREDRGKSWVHAADELYLVAGREPPTWDDYDAFPQFENGIGMVRAFSDEIFALARETEPASGEPAPVTLVTGTLFAPVLAGLSSLLAAFGACARVLPVVNRLLGETVTVAGLLAGEDIAAAVTADAEARGPYLVPDAAVDREGALLDGTRVDDVRSRTGEDVRLVSCDAAGLAFALREIAAETSG